MSRRKCKVCGHVHREGTFQTGSYGGRATFVYPCDECGCRE